MAVFENKHGRRAAAVATIALAVAASVAQPAQARDVGGDGVETQVVDPSASRDGIKAMQLGCTAGEAHIASIGCRWSAVGDASAYHLVRTELGVGTPRVTVARITEPLTTNFVDSPVRRGVRYVYVVRAYDAGRNLIAASRPSVAGVAASPTLQQLRLECSATSSTTVRCAMPTPIHSARTLTVWRSVDGGARHSVGSFEAPFPASYGDVVPDGTSNVLYALIATDGSGEIVARSRAESVRMPGSRAASDDPVVTDQTRPRPYPDDAVDRSPRGTDVADDDVAVRRNARSEVIGR